MRRAMPYPCSGPSASSVFSTISARVPCHTSFCLPIWDSHMSMRQPAAGLAEPAVSLVTLLCNVNPEIQLGNSELPPKLGHLRWIESTGDAHHRQLTGFSGNHQNPGQLPVAGVF